MSKINLSPATRRLMPLYIAAFLQSIPFWYAIEKLFMVGIGFTTASIGLTVAITSFVILTVETPSGVLADRWSRKGVMILGCAALFISTLIGALSYSEPVYLISFIFWGIYAAFYSGTYEAVIYDTAIEEDGNSQNFERYLGKLRAVEGISFIIGALVGGYIATVFDMRDTYILTLPLVATAVLFIWKYREPMLHRAEATVPVFKHIRQTFGVVLKNPVLLPIVVAIVGFGVLQETIFELSQLWFIAIDTPIVLYGILSAVVFSSWAIGGLVAPRIKTKPATYALMSMLVVSIILMIVTRNFLPLLIAQFILAVCLVALSVILAQKMHDQLPSRLRAGSSSVVSTLARIILIPGSIIFTVVANNYTIFTATYMLLGVAIVSAIAFFAITPLRQDSTIE